MQNDRDEIVFLCVCKREGERLRDRESDIRRETKRERERGRYRER